MKGFNKMKYDEIKVGSMYTYDINSCMHGFEIGEGLIVDKYIEGNTQMCVIYNKETHKVIYRSCNVVREIL
jgi:hypothetical protein